MGGHCVACDRCWHADSQLVMSYWSPSTTSTASFVCLYRYSSTFACGLHLTKCSGQHSPSRHSCSACCYRTKEATKRTDGLDREEPAIKEAWKIENANAGVMSWGSYWKIALNPLKHLLSVTLKKKKNADKCNSENSAAHIFSEHKEPKQGFENYHTLQDVMQSYSFQGSVG